MRKFVLQCVFMACAVAPACAFADPDPALWLDRITWGANAASWQALQAQGMPAFLQQQLDPHAPDALPPEVQARIDAMDISRRPTVDLVRDLDRQRRDAEGAGDPERKKAARKAFKQAAEALAREAATRHLLRAIYSPAQLREQMTWFWLNHFNVYSRKHALGALVADYEDRAIRPHALGRFRDLLGATLHHPAMLLYLDNARNAAGQINENYARELMELHTLGVDGGYTQRDVQELARVLTGVGVLPLEREKAARAHAVQVDGLFAYYPRRHDNGDKRILGVTIKGRGYPEVEEVLDMLARHPATARNLSRQLAQYFVSDTPSPALIDAMAQTYLRTDGDIAAVLATMFATPEFNASLGHKFKDPMHYVVSAARQGYDGRVIMNADPLLKAVQRLGESLYEHQTPDGYALDMAAWASPGQMTARFDIAQAMGGPMPALLQADEASAAAPRKESMPSLNTAFFQTAIAPRLSANTRAALAGAHTPKEWNGIWLAAPEFMMR